VLPEAFQSRVFGEILKQIGRLWIMSEPFGVELDRPAKVGEGFISAAGHCLEGSQIAPRLREFGAQPDGF